MSTLGILSIITIMVNSEIFIKYKSEHLFSQQDEIQKLILNSKKVSYMKS